MALKFGDKEWFVIIVSILFLTDLAVFLDLPFLRQILGFFFLTILPGLLILQILKLNKIGSTEKVVLSVGLSISFLMFFGLLLNNLSLSFGYKTPLSTISLLLLFNLAFITLGIIGYKLNKPQTFFLMNLNLSLPEKGFLMVPIFFPVLSIFGTHIMNTTNNNIILMFLLFLIPIYIAFVCFFNQKFTRRLYSVVIFLISISLLLIFMLRFPHIYGNDIHTEYYFFQTTFDNLHWSIFEHSILDACLSVSLLPTIFQSIMNLNAQEYLFKGIYVSICSFGPLTIYILSKKYIGELYAFLASFFFISQLTFLSVAGNPRTNVAIFFVALAFTAFFSDKIDPLKRRILFVVFMTSCIVSHYSTAYIFFFIMLGSFIGIKILLKKYTFKKTITLTIVLLFFALIFFWYSQITERAFNSGVSFIERTAINLNKFFIEESRASQVKKLIGKELAYPVLSRANLAFTWGIFIFIGIGILTMLKRYKEMIDISNVKFKKIDFLKTKFEMEYLVIALACIGLLVVMVALPYISVAYSIQRLYFSIIIILSIHFVIGGMMLSKHLFFLLQNTFLFCKSLYGKIASQETCIKRKSCFFGRAFFFKERLDEKNASQVWSYLVILSILVPYFLFQTGAMYEIFGAPAGDILSSKGEGYDREYVHDSESCAAKWLMTNGEKTFRIYTPDPYGELRLISQGKISPNRIDNYSFSRHRKLEGYIYLNYYNVIKGKLTVKDITHSMTEYSDMIIEKNKVYNSGGSEIYR